MKHLKIAIMAIIFIFLMFSISTYVHAIDMYLTSTNLEQPTSMTPDEDYDNTIKTNTTSEENESENLITTGVPAENTNSSNSSRVITSREATSSNELTTSDIINIILIAVGVVIILLAVAILIRCK